MMLNPSVKTLCLTNSLQNKIKFYLTVDSIDCADEGRKQFSLEFPSNSIRIPSALFPGSDLLTKANTRIPHSSALLCCRTSLTSASGIYGESLFICALRPSRRWKVHYHCEVTLLT
jgi:hypothetical protein